MIFSWWNSVGALDVEVRNVSDRLILVRDDNGNRTPLERGKIVTIRNATHPVFWTVGWEEHRFLSATIDDLHHGDLILRVVSGETPEGIRTHRAEFYKSFPDSRDVIIERILDRRGHVMNVHPFSLYQLWSYHLGSGPPVGWFR